MTFDKFREASVQSVQWESMTS